MRQVWKVLGWIAIGFWAECAAAAPAATSWLDRVVDGREQSYRIDARGIVTDASHPKHPGDFTVHEGTLRIHHDPLRRQAVIELETEEAGAKDVDRYFTRAGRVFQVDVIDHKDVEIVAKPLGDLSAAAVAALDPTLVAEAIAGRRENVHWKSGRDAWFAWNDEQWRVHLTHTRGRMAWLEHAVHHDVLGDGLERVRFEEWGTRDPALPGRIVVTLRGRETARFEVGAITSNVPVDCAKGDPERDRARWLAPGELRFDDLAPGLFYLDLTDQNTRVLLAEFADFVVVLEGAYTSQICDRIATHVSERFHKPVRYFAFSHLHGQYVGGTRSWIHEGATILVPPSTAPLIEDVARARNDLRPDALLRDPRPLDVETIPDRRQIEDAANALTIYNVESGHTDEYFIFYFPRQKVLATGDLLFYRPGKPLTGRSKMLCETVRKLGLDVERYYATWPLDGYGTKNVVTKEEMREACGG